MIYSAENISNKIVSNLLLPRTFYYKATQLFMDIMKNMIEDNNLISTYLSILRKLVMIPKKLTDPLYCKDSMLKENLLKMLKINIQMLKNVNDIGLKNLSNYSDTMLSKEYPEFTEYYGSSIFNKLSEDLIKKDTGVKIQGQIIECMSYICQINFVISDSYISCENVKILLTMLDNSYEDFIIQESINFLINFHISSYKLKCYANFILFQSEDSDREEKIFEMFLKPNTSEHVKFMICCLFLTISVLKDIWGKLKRINIIKPTSRFIYQYILKTFNVSFKEENPESALKLQKINILVKIFSFISSIDNYKQIFHIDFFKYYFDTVILLFRIYHPSFRLDILNTLNTFTFFYDSKNRFFEEKNKIVIELIHKRSEHIYGIMKKLYEQYSDCIKNKNNLKNKRDNMESIPEYKNKFNENISLLEDLSQNTKHVFFISAEEFGLLISIILNLLLNNDYNQYSSLLVDKNFFREKKNVTENDSQVDITDKGGILFQYEKFFRNIELFKNDLRTHCGTHGPLNLYIFQISLIKLINNPIGRIEFNKFNDFNQNDEEIELNNINSLYEMLKSYNHSIEILHKVIYAINRFICFSRKIKSYIETIKKIIEEIRSILFNDKKSTVMLNRECLRLLITLTQFSDQTLMWLKFDSTKVYIDYSNFSDVILLYKDQFTDWHVDDKDRERIIFPPYLKVQSYADKMGVIFYGDHVLVLPKKLNLGDNFTIWFRFFNPVINSNKWHVLIQQPSGLGGLIVIDSSRRKLGCFTEDGEFIDSGIDLSAQEYKNKWILVTMCFRSRKEKIIEQNLKQINDGDKVIVDNSEQVRLDWYVNAVKKKVYENQKIILPRIVQYIGNSRNFDEPFGVFCDVRIFRNYLNEHQVKNLYNTEEKKKIEKSELDLIYYVYHKILDTVIENFLNSNDTSEETFYFTIKFFNNIMVNRSHRSKFINYGLIMKISPFFNSNKAEIRKEVAKFIQTLA